MLSSYQITDLVTRNLPESSWGEVNRRIRFEPNVWASCSKEDLLHALLRRPNAELPSQWKPGIVGLVALTTLEPETAPDPQAWLTQTAPGRSRLASAYDALFSTNGSTAKSDTEDDCDLRTQALIASTIEAIALRQSSKNSSQPDMETICQVAAKNVQRWAASLTCLYGLLEDPQPLVENLLASGSTEAVGLVVRAWLANKSPDELPGLLNTIVPTLDISLQLALGHAFRENGSNTLSRLVGAAASLETAAVKLSDPDMTNLPSAAQQIVHRAKSGLLLALSEDEMARTNLTDTIQDAQMLAGELALALGKAELKSGNAVSALAAFEQAHALGIDETSTRCLIAEARIALGQPEQARTLLAHSPDNSERTLLTMARAQCASGDFIMAEETALQAVERASDRETLLGLASVLSDAGSSSAAANALGRAVSLLPPSSSVLSWQSKELLHCGKSMQAREAAYEAVALNPDSAESRVALAQALSSSTSRLQADHEKALDQWERAIELEPEYMPAWIGFAKCALDLDKPQKARDLAEKALTCSAPSNLSEEDMSGLGEAHSVIGQACEALGDPAEAMEHFQKAAAVAPSSPAPWMAMAHHHRCNAELDKAIAALQSGIQSVNARNPADAARLWTHAAEIREELGMAGEAIDALREAVRLQPTNGFAHRHLGNLLIAQGQTSQAVQSLGQAAKYLATDAEVWHELAQATDADGDSEEALIAYQHAQDAGHESASLSKNLGKLAFRLGKHDLARSNLELAAGSGSADIETLTMLAQGLEQTNDTQQALEIYQRAIQLDPDQTDLLVHIGACCLKLERPEAAIAALASAANDHPEDLLIQLTLGEAYMQAKLWNEALKSLEKARAIDPGDPRVIRLIAHASHEGGHTEQAIKTLLEATRIHPTDANLHVELGRSYCRAEQWTDAKAALIRAVELEPENTSHMLILGDCMKSMGDMGEATQTLERAALLEPENPSVLQALGELFSVSGNHNAAHNVFLRAASVIHKGDLGSSNTSTNSERAVSLKRAGDSLWALGDKSEAISIWEKALSDAPDDVEVQSQLGSALLARGRPEEALEAFEAAAKLDPESVTHVLDAAEAAVALGEMHRAQQHLGSITQKTLETPENLYRLGRIYRAMGHSEDALTALRQACELAPQNAMYLVETAEALAEIGNISEATVMTEAVLAAEPDNLRMLKGVGKVFLMAGKYRKAWDALNRVIHAETTDTATQVSIAQDLVLDAEKRHHAMQIDTDLSHGSRQDLLINDAISRASEAETEPNELQEWRARAMVTAGKASEAIPLLEPLANKQDSSDLDCSLASAYCQVGELERARQVLGQVFQRDPSHVSALIVSSRIDAIQGNAEAEIATLRRAIQFAPNSATAHYMLGVALCKASDIDNGMAAFSRALHLDPNQPAWHFRMAQLHRQHSGLDTALSYYQQAVQLSLEQQLPESIIAEYSAALAHSHAEDADFSAARQEYEKAIKLVADKPEWQTAAGQACLNTGHPEAALTYFDKASSLMPDEIEALIGGIRALMLLGRMTEAEERTLHALKLDATNGEALLALGELFAARGDHINSLASLDQALDNADDQRPVLLAKARVMAESGNNEQALHHLEKALDLDIHDHSVWELAGELYASSGNIETARNAYNRACQIAPLVFRYHLRLGQLCRLSDHLDQALVHLNQATALELNSEEQSQVQAELGKVFEARGQFDRAYKAYSAAIQQQPKAASNHFRAGVALKQLKDYDLAAAMFKQAIELDPKNVDAHRQLAAVSALGLVSGAAV